MFEATIVDVSMVPGFMTLIRSNLIIQIRVMFSIKLKSLCQSKPRVYCVKIKEFSISVVGVSRREL